MFLLSKEIWVFPILMIPLKKYIKLFGGSYFKYIFNFYNFFIISVLKTSITYSGTYLDFKLVSPSRFLVST